MTDSRRADPAQSAAAPDSQLEVIELVSRVRSGDRAAEDMMVQRYSRGIRFLLLHLTNRSDKVDDFFQETMRLGIEKVRAGELREPEKLPYFLRSIARNLVIAEVRKSRRHPTARGGEELDDDAEVVLPPDSSPDPLRRAMGRQEASLVRRLLARLEPPRDREVLVRFFVAEHSKESICADLDLSSLHFNRVLYRARKRLRKLVESHLEGALT